MVKNYLYFILLFILIFSCRTNKNKQDTSVITRKDLVDIIVDLHKLDGILSVYSIRKEYTSDQIHELYDKIIEKHGYTRKQFENSIVYYTADLERFNDLYDKVINELSKMESAVNPSNKEGGPPKNLWNQKTIWELPKDGERNRIFFSIPINAVGMYSIKAKIKLYADDQSVNPEMKAYFWYDDNTHEGHREYFSTRLEKNNKETIYFISKANNSNKVTQLNGWILYNEESDKKWSKHAEIKEIEVTCKTLGNY